MQFHRQTAIEKRLSQMRVLCLCDAKEISTIARMAENRTVAPGEILTEQGKQAREFMIIMSGEAMVERDGEQLAALGEGDFFGEMAVLSGGHRTATVTAITPMELEVISRRDFLSVLEQAPHLTVKILQSVAARLEESDRTGERYLTRTEDDLDLRISERA